MRVVLLHELAHARRGDWMLYVVAEASRCVWWFNPLAWTVRTRLRRESEHAADDLVLAQGVPATTCAMHLVELAREVRKHRRTWLPAPAMARPSHLERRLSTMLNPHTNRRPMTRLARFGSLGVLVLIAILVASLEVARAVEQEPQTEPPGAVVRRVTINGENVPELVARAALQEQLATVLSELQTLLNGPDRLADRSNEPFRLKVQRHVVDQLVRYHRPAQTAGVQGRVILGATIDPSGEVGDIEVLWSVPELDEAAIAAAEQWRYEPTLVDGVAVPVSMTLIVNFSLSSP